MGPLSGLRVIELAGIGPGPFCAMMLADMGAEVIRVDRKGAGGGSKFDILSRNRRSIALDLKKPEAVETVLRLVEKADAIQEGFRPGVTERLGLGPDVCLARNPKLVYGRMTGWGQDGPLAQAAGHDINYIALSGALAAIGEPGRKPVAPLNLVGDFGGGAMYLAFGMVCALLEAQRSGKGQVVDAAMVDGAASLMSMFFSFTASGMWSDQRGTNLLDGGAHFYDTYECADGQYVAIGSIEPQFYALLRDKAGLTDPAFDAQMDRAAWPDLKAKVAAVFKTKTRAEWTAMMEGTDICFAPVLSLAEVKSHPHNQARGTIINVAGVDQAAPAPRFSRTIPATPKPPSRAGSDTKDVLGDWGFSATEIAGLESAQVI
jgi:alpha-methylacyl-CoA racemase